MSAKEKLEPSNATIAMAAMLIGKEMPTIERFLSECRNMDSFGPIFDPTLFLNKERQVVSAALEPIYRAAREFCVTYESHTAKLKTAAAAVGVTLGARA